MGSLTEALGRLSGQRWGLTAFINTDGSAGGSRPPTRAGPLDRGYVRPARPKQRLADRLVQLIMRMKKLYADGDRTTFDGLVRKFDALANRIDRDPEDPAFMGWLYRHHLFPKWTPDEEP